MCLPFDFGRKLAAQIKFGAGGFTGKTKIVLSKRTAEPVKPPVLPPVTAAPKSAAPPTRAPAPPQGLPAAPKTVWV
jgi:hypothetical protein